MKYKKPLIILAFAIASPFAAMTFVWFCHYLGLGSVLSFVGLGDGTHEHSSMFGGFAVIEIILAAVSGALFGFVLLLIGCILFYRERRKHISMK